MNVDDLLRADVDFASLAKEKLDDGLVRVGLGVVQGGVAVAVFPGERKSKNLQRSQDLKS